MFGPFTNSHKMCHTKIVHHSRTTPALCNMSIPCPLFFYTMSPLNKFLKRPIISNKNIPDCFDLSSQDLHLLSLFLSLKTYICDCMQRSWGKGKAIFLSDIPGVRCGEPSLDLEGLEKGDGCSSHQSRDRGVWS